MDLGWERQEPASEVRRVLTWGGGKKGAGGSSPNAGKEGKGPAWLGNLRPGRDMGGGPGGALMGEVTDAASSEEAARGKENDGGNRGVGEAVGEEGPKEGPVEKVGGRGGGGGDRRSKNREAGGLTVGDLAPLLLGEDDPPPRHRTALSSVASFLGLPLGPASSSSSSPSTEAFSAADSSSIP